jgi:hypothetical protein
MEIKVQGVTCDRASWLISGYLDEPEGYARGGFTCGKVEEGDFVYWRCEDFYNSP